MSFKTTAVLLVLLAVLGGVVWYTGRLPPAEEQEKAKKTPLVLDFKQGDVQTLEFVKGDQRVNLRRQGETQWRLLAPEDAPADDSRVSPELKNLAELRADRVIDENPSDLAPFGLDKPALTVKIGLTDGRQVQLLLGKESPGSPGRYARNLDRSPVYLISSFRAEAWEQLVTQPPKSVPPTPTPTAVPTPQ